MARNGFGAGIGDLTAYETQLHHTVPEPGHIDKPAGTSPVLNEIAAVARDLIERLQSVREGYPPNALACPDPVYVALDQAIAAGQDLHVNLQQAVEMIIERDVRQPAGGHDAASSIDLAQTDRG